MRVPADAARAGQRWLSSALLCLGTLVDGTVAPPWMGLRFLVADDVQLLF